MSTSAEAGFAGSYDPADVTFLLKPAHIAPVPTAEKERLIQSGARHYSEMLSEEKLPSRRYVELFEHAMAANAERMARDVVRLARGVGAAGGDPVLVSLARAGTPLGVLLRRALARLGVEAPHYSVSIIRDRGIDAVALDHIRARHDERGIVFVDGWTGKGAITRELHASVARYNGSRGAQVPPRLAVLADLAGVADLSATEEDYLIPSSILNSVVSGLVSRTVLNDALVGPGDFHACRYYAEYEAHDRSREFVERIDERVAALIHDPALAPALPDPARAHALQAESRRFVEGAMARFALTDDNRVKPGIGESTRALLRRMPERLLLRDREGADVRHLVHLAAESGVPIEIQPDLPYRATVIIQTLGE